MLPDEHVRAALSAAVTVEEVMRTICAKLGRLLAHHEALEGEPVGTLGKPVVDADLDAAEAVMGRLLPEDARALYLCRNGSMGFSPDVEFRTLETALKIWRIGYGGLELPILSNAPGWVEPEVRYPVLDMDRVGLCVLTTVGSRRRTSPVLLLDVDADQFTVVAYTFEALIDWFIDGFERGEAELTEHGVFWKSEEIMAFPPDMQPLGTATGPDPLG